MVSDPLGGVLGLRVGDRCGFRGDWWGSGV